MKSRTFGILLITVAATLWGTWPLYTRGAPLSGLQVGFITLTVMALPSVFTLRRRDFSDRGAVAWLVAIGLADAGNCLLYFSALSKGPVVAAVLTHYLAPPLVALTAPWVLKEPPSRRARIATPLVLVALGLVLSSAGAEGDVLHTGLLGAGSGLFYAMVVLGSRRAGQTFSALAVTSLHAAVSALTLWLLFGDAVMPPSLELAAPVLGAAVVNGLVAAVMFNRALGLIGAQLVGVFTYLEPLTASLLGIILFREPASILTAVGVAAIIGLGAWVAAEAPQRIAAGDSASP